MDQQIAILDMNGKGSYTEWKKLFEAFGLQVYCIEDFDFAIDCFYPSEKGTSLSGDSHVKAFKERNQDWESKIDSVYGKGIFILKNGDLEHYLNISKTEKGLTKTIDFCNTKIQSYLNDESNLESKEIKEIFRSITS
jgi:hypothetical protein